MFGDVVNQKREIADNKAGHNPFHGDRLPKPLLFGLSNWIKELKTKKLEER